MKIQTSETSMSQPTFNGLHVINPMVQKLLLTSLNSKELETLSDLTQRQQNNSVHIFLDSINEKRLKASLMCSYRLQDFKTKYKQIPFLESKLHFIKRVANAADKYKKQIENLEVHKLKWDYPILREWAEKILKLAP